MQTFGIAPAGLRSLWILAPVGLILAGTTALLVMTLLGSWTARFEISAEGLRLRGDLYGRFIPARELRPAEAKRVDLTAEPGLVPRHRRWGTGLPGYQSGWFQLANGDDALLYLSDRSRAVYVPTTRGHALLLSPKDPDAFMAALRALDRS
jgi:hypothetical protein